MMMILLVVLLLFGGKRMPELARGLGKSIREFKKATSGIEEQIKQAMDDVQEPERPIIAKAIAAPAPTPIIAPPTAPTVPEPPPETAA